MRLLVTRPEEDGRALVSALEALGHVALHAPLMEVAAVEGAIIPDVSPQALLVTSANAARHAAQHGAAAKWMSAPVFAVGDASAAAARDHGFASVVSAGGDVGALAALVAARLRPDDGPLLHVAGSVTAGDLKGMLEGHGFEVRRAVLYETRAAQRLPDMARAALQARRLDGVLIFSPRTGLIFRELVTAAGLQAALSQVTAYCLSDAVAEGLREVGFRDIRVSSEPTQASLLDLLGPEPE